MAASLLTLLIALSVAIGAFHHAAAVDYSVTNRASGTTGGNIFDSQIGIPYATEVLQTSSSFIWNTFKQGEADRKSVAKVSMFVDTMDGVAYASNNEIHVSANHIANVAASSGDVKREVTGILYHEMTHVWQWNGDGLVNDQTRGAVIEGIADYIRLKSGYPAANWPKPGQGKNWDEGYAVTAFFLDYCNSLKDGFVAELNGKMKVGYKEKYFEDILGKNVNQLWADYKAKYGTS